MRKLKKCGGLYNTGKCKLNKNQWKQANLNPIARSEVCAEFGICKIKPKKLKYWTTKEDVKC